METTNCPTCGAVAEIVNRDVREYEEEFTTSINGELIVAWLPGFMEFVTVRCLGSRSHTYSGPLQAILGDPRLPFSPEPDKSALQQEVTRLEAD